MKNFFLLFIIFLSLSVDAQVNTSEVEQQFRDYSSLIKDKRFGRAIDQYANEELLEIIPREQILQSMEQIFNSPEIEFKIYDPQNINIDSEEFIKNNKSYCKLNYDQRIDLKFNSNVLSVEQLMTALSNEFGAANVQHNTQTGYFEINSHKDAIATSTDRQHWKFTVLEKNQIPVLRNFLPEELLRSLN